MLGDFDLYIQKIKKIFFKIKDKFMICSHLQKFMAIS